MRLYRFEHSCYARFVQCAFELAGVPCQVVDVPYGDRTELAELTGGYVQVPVLVTDGGEVVTDSRRIVERLTGGDARFAALAPAADAAAVWAYLDWVQGPLEEVAFRLASPGLRHRFASAWERALFVLVKERKFGAGCVRQWRRDGDALFARLVELLAPTVATLAGRRFVIGGAPTLADAALYGQLAMLELGAPERVAELAGELHAWKRRLEQRMGPPPYGRAAGEHRSIAAIEAALAAAAPRPRAATLELIVVRTRVHERAVPEAIELVPGRGLAGDHWMGDGAEQEVSIMDARVAAAVAARDDWPLFGDNLFVDLAIGEDALQAGDRLAVGDVVLEISAYPHLGCRKLMARFGTDALRWMNARPHRAQRRRGVYARIVAGGTIRVGDPVRRP